jgi:uncharacterized protein YrrD
MQKVNELFGKRVIDMRSGNQIAAVRDVVLDGDMRRILALVIGDGRWGAKDRVLRWRELAAVGEFVIVDGEQALPALSEDAEVRGLREGAAKVTGKKVISASGEQIGIVDDIYYERSGAVLGYEIRRGMFGGHPALRASDVRSVGKDAIIAESTSLVPREELSLGRPAPAESLYERAAGEPMSAGRPAIDPALGEPDTTDSHRDM